MRKFMFMFAVVFLALSPQCKAATGTPSEYDTLLAALKAGDTKIDFTRLRLSYMDSPEYQRAKDTTDAERAMAQALNAKDYAKALKEAETVLDSEYVNIDAHFIALVANRELGNADQSEFHRAIFRGLVDSIRNSGDGLSMEKAWVVINVHEEYVMLRVLGFQPSGQSLAHKDGHSYDVMTVKNVESGKEQTFYFNVDIPFKHYSQ
jgi:hypothetical protein